MGYLFFTPDSASVDHCVCACKIQERRDSFSFLSTTAPPRSTSEVTTGRATGRADRSPRVNTLQLLAFCSTCLSDSWKCWLTASATHPAVALSTISARSRSRPARSLSRSRSIHSTFTRFHHILDFINTLSQSAFELWKPKENSGRQQLSGAPHATRAKSVDKPMCVENWTVLPLSHASTLTTIRDPSCRRPSQQISSKYISI